MHQGTSHLTLFLTLHLRHKSRDKISFRAKDCNTRVLDLGIYQLMSDLILRLRIESEIDPSSVFELGSRGKTGTSGFGTGTSGNIRILWYFTWILRTWKFISHILILFAIPKRYKPLFTLLSRPPRALSLPQALNTKSTIPNPSQDLERCKLAWRIIPSNHYSLGWLQF